MTGKKYNSKHIVIYGGGGHAKSVIDLIRTVGGYTIVGIVDDGLDVNSEVLGVPILGDGSTLTTLAEQGLEMAVNAVGGIGAPEKRIAVFDRLKQYDFKFPGLIHPRAVVEPTAKIGDGSQVFALSYVGSDSTVGFGCILNYGSITSHDCQLGDYVNLSPGATLAGGVVIGACTQIGMRVTINLDLKVGTNVRVGNGATIKKSIPDNTVIRAGTIYPPLQENQ